MIDVRLSGVRDWDELGHRWRALEHRTDLSFFQSWTWIGCLAAERYPDPVLVEAVRDGQAVGLALFSRRRRGLHQWLTLHESGDAALDSPFIEHNGIVGEPITAMVQAVCRGFPPRRLVLSGVGDATLAAVRRTALRLRVVQSRPAPFADLARDFLAGRSANTRQRLRRSDRAYGEVMIRRAANVAEAHATLDELAALHQASWRRRGKAGAFATPFFGRFHRALIDRGLQRDEIDLLRVSANDRTIGVLYNLRFRGRALAYQSGFDYANAHGAARPGLTCHHAAIRLAAAQGLREYDFLAGNDRYKRSLSDGAVRLHWLEAGRFYDLGFSLRCAAAAAGSAFRLSSAETEGPRRPAAPRHDGQAPATPPVEAG